MNILYLLNYAGKGGSEKYIKDFTKNFHNKSLQIHFIYNIEGELVNEMKELGVTPIQMVLKHPFHIGAAKEVAKYCKENKIDIIHTQYQRENYIAILSKLFYKKVKVVYTCHVIVKNNLIWKITNSCMTKFDDGIIAVCEEGKRQLIENKMPTEKIKVIANGVPYEKYVFNVSNSSIREEFKINNDTFVFVSLTRFTLEKGTLFLLKSVKELKERIEIPFIILMVGDGILLNEAKEYVSKNDLNENVIFTNYRKDSENILKGSNVFINSSNNEALSFAILEAMSKCLPIIATKVGGNVDIVNENTNCGIIVNYNNPVEMAQAMEKLMTDKKFWGNCSNNSLLAIKERFNSKNVLKETLSLYVKAYLK